MFPTPVKYLGQLFAQNGHQVRVVGGWVRDTIRGVAPKDLDLCTTALPEQILELCREHDLSYLDSGLKHGTVGIILDQTMFDVTTLRIDTETDGRHATVEYTTDWRADAARRDFTMNAMSMDLDGNLYDYFDGHRHIAEKRVVFVGDPATRIREDYLRILRYYRFLGCINGRFIEDTELERTMFRNAPGLQQISAERIWSEMSRILSGNDLDVVLMSMYVAHVLDNIGLSAPAGGDISRAANTRIMTDNPITVLAALTPEPMAERWRLSRADASLLRWLQHARNGRAPNLDDLKNIATTKGLGHQYAIEWAALFGPHQNVNMIRDWPVPVFPVMGEDLIALGMEPGPGMGLALSRLENIWKTSKFSFNKDRLLGFLYVED